MMRTWAVSDRWYEIQVPVIAETRSRAKTIGGFGREYLDVEWIDLRCKLVRSLILIEGPERILSVPESLEFGFRWNNETMADYFDGWYGCWLYERVL